MGAAQVWRRLLWKEYREGWFVVLLALVAPFVMFRFAATCPGGSMIRILSVVLGAVGAHLAVAFWAAGRGGSKRTGSEFAWTHLPTNPAVEWLASMIVPMIVIALMGLLYGLAAGPAVVGFTYRMSIPLAGMLDLATTFAICYLISMVVSNWAAYVFGVFRLVGGTMISVWDLNVIATPDTVSTVARTLASAILAAFVYVVLLRKKSMAARQVAALGIVVLVTFVPLLPQVSVGKAITALVAARLGNDELCSYNQESADGSVTVRVVKPYMPGKGYLVMRDYRRKITRKRLLPACKVFLVQPDGRAYMAHSSASGVEITEWNGVTDTLRKITTLPVKGQHFGGDGWRCEVSPDGAYMALLLKSILHELTMDLWLIDLRRGTAKVALPDAAPNASDDCHQWHLGWPKGEVAIWEATSGAIAVNVHTLATRRIALDEEVDKR